MLFPGLIVIIIFLAVRLLSVRPYLLLQKPLKPSPAEVVFPLLFHHIIGVTNFSAYHFYDDQNSFASLSVNTFSKVSRLSFFTASHVWITIEVLKICKELES